MIRIAITGGICEGKSTVLEYCRELGRQTVSSDEIARNVFAEPRVQSGLAAIVGFGPPADREAVRAALAADPLKRRRVNELMHAAIMRQIFESSAQVIEVPLLIEACLQGHFERIWVVTCGEVEQMRRLTDRLGDPEAARKMLSTQLPTRAKTVFADLIVRTNPHPADVKRYISAALDKQG